ncbi:MAG: secondary thiamine-phosphate synthase enzyme YjbQ [Anaerolineales bacterium]|nr:secondary thiamine-phosphate synthase enzyme YjbQ [Anaerolineales bacterium]
MSVTTDTINLRTQGHADAHDITKRVAQLVRDTGLQNGTVTVFCPSSTSALTTIEFEDGCLQDLRRLFDEIADPARDYAHNARWGDGNGHAHARAALLGPSLSVPFVSGKLTLGTWQQIIFVDFDNRPRQRELVAQVIGE